MQPSLNWFTKQFVEESSLSKCSNINTKPTSPKTN